MARSYIRRLAASTIAATLLSLRAGIRQHLFLVTFAPFALVLIAALLMPAGSQTLSYRLLLKVSIGAGSVVLFLGVILTATAGLPAEIRRGSAFRTVCSPGGRVAALTGRIGAFSILAALAAGVGFLGTLATFHLRACGYEEFASASRQYRTVSAANHLLVDIPEKSYTSGIIWIDEEAPFIGWLFPKAPAEGVLRLQVVPVVASSLETTATVALRAGPSNRTRTRTIVLFDNRPTDIEFHDWPAGEGPLWVIIERLPDSTPFGFDIRKNELGSERNGISLVTSEHSFTLNMLTAWFVIWLKLCFGASLAVFCSTFLSGPIAAALALMLYLLTNLLGFLHGFAASIGKLGAHVHVHHIEHAPLEPTLTQQVLKKLLTSFTYVYPDLTRFDPVDPLAWGRSIPLAFVALALLYYLAYSAGLWGASALIIRRKEF